MTIEIDNQIENRCYPNVDTRACAFLDKKLVVVPPDVTGKELWHEIKHLIMDCNFHGQNFGHKCKTF